MKMNCGDGWEHIIIITRTEDECTGLWGWLRAHYHKNQNWRLMNRTVRMARTHYHKNQNWRSIHRTVRMAESPLPLEPKLKINAQDCEDGWEHIIIITRTEDECTGLWGWLRAHYHKNQNWRLMNRTVRMAKSTIPWELELKMNAQDCEDGSDTLP
jgi:hypothetical protein